METYIGLEFAGAIILLLFGGVIAAFMATSWRIDHVETESQTEIANIKKQCAIHLADMAKQAESLSSVCDLTREDVQYIRTRIDNL